ncbi:hypothetical protein CPB84DRAFT_945772 [Gymnopilus junonius]|uniref:Uncharacterized protein n=1 Tax=Gymnopilus junonius TaxID=109634 RepID=A0A9P5NLU6_GYMJU|nr:hypothetical protein CPB84DRAFT_945772 [Gymnopilus junonius]
MRLLILSLSLAVKCFEDRSFRLTEIFQSYRALGISALQAFDYRIFLLRDQWTKHLTNLLNWTREPKSHLQAIYLRKIRLLLVNAAAQSPSGIQWNSYHSIVPSPSSISKVHAGLLAGLNLPAHRLQAANEVIADNPCMRRLTPADF